MGDTQRGCFSVTQLLTECDRLLKQCFQQVTVEGEVSNLMHARSGHWYFSLKDTHGNARCACFKQHAQRLPITLTEGMAVVVTAQVAIYQARGDFQLIISNIRLQGDGALKQRFEALKAQLEVEGLFNPDRKKSLPTYPQTLGVVTSSSGAALQDIIATLKRRAPQIRVIVYPCFVQGEMAKDSICQALRLAEQHDQADVLILARGGGSLEDLWPFNEEKVARCLANCSLPIISGVGHEVDTTLVDFIADQRAPTPTAAAEVACLDQQTLIQQISHQRLKLRQSIRQTFSTLRRQLDLHKQALKHPKHTIQQHMQTLDLTMNQLQNAMRQRIAQKRLALTQPVAALDALNPSKLLQSGLAMVQKDGQILNSAKQLHAGDLITVQFYDGSVIAGVK